MMHNVSQLQRFGCLLLIGWCFLCVRYFYPHMGDDSFIFFRYADFFGQGQGLRWSASGIAVEGFSSPLWTIWLGVWSIWFDPVSVSRATGIICVVLTLVQLFRLGQGGLSVLWGATFTMGIHYWGTSGLETPLYTLLFINVLPLLEQRESAHTRSVSWLSLALLGVCRPEAPAIICAVLAMIWWKERTLSLQSFVVCIPMLLWQLIRLTYYEDILPNTYWAKASGDVMLRLSSGWTYGKWLLPPLLLGVWRSEEKRSWSLVIALWSIVVCGGGDWMWHHRLLVPVIAGVWLLSEKIEGLWRWGIRLFLVYFWMRPLMFWAVLSSLWTGKTLPITEYQEGNLIEVSENLASDIRQVYPGTITIAVNHAGALPYFLPEHEFIDMSALNDRYLARVEGGLHEKYDADYVLSQNPELIVLNSFVDPKVEGGQYQPDYWVGETVLYQHSQFVERYVPIAQSWRRVRHGGGFASIWLFKRRKQ